MEGKDSVMFSKKSDEWETPDWLYNMLDEEFLFELDAAATAKNTKSCGFYDKGDDALVQPWYEDYGEDGCVKSVFLNPPHSKIAAFMKKAYEESMKGAIVVCLIPCRTDTRYWHNYVMKAHEIRLIQGRLKFENRALPSWTPDGNHKISPAPFPSCIVIFDHHKYDKNNDPVFKTLTPPINTNNNNNTMEVCSD